MLRNIISLLLLTPTWGYACGEEITSIDIILIFSIPLSFILFIGFFIFITKPKSIIGFLKVLLLSFLGSSILYSSLIFLPMLILFFLFIVVFIIERKKYL